MSDKEYCDFLSKNYSNNDYWVVLSVEKDGKIENLFTSNYALYLFTYKKSPLKLSYSQFLYRYIVHEKKLAFKFCNCKNFNKLNINKKLYQLYILKGIQFIIKNYTKRVDGLAKLNNIMPQYKDTILLIMAENNYLITQDDYSGEYIFFDSIPK
ncbi:hypothetical protein GJR95_22705 [Spirosoma endbachense]|uniref:Uncharacterized protein n=1 Tax=Spirosoma endbachense TaxID=2666025 RepID=A0A6P1VYD4_9BACT|nr:hypothetical protein GJR95_22705 [Spirosoma endbachense]